MADESHPARWRRAQVVTARITATFVKKQQRKDARLPVMTCAPPIEKAVEKACEFIAAHFNEPLSLNSIARHVGYSVFHFHREFHDRTGMSIWEYVLETRLSAAREKLLHSSARIIDVALDVGFECPESFARAFRRFYAVTPSEFRKLDGPTLKHTRDPRVWEQSKRRPAMPYEMVHLLSVAVERQASDLTVAPGVPPYICVNGSLDIVGPEVVTIPEARRMFESVTSDEDQEGVRQCGKADYSFWFENVARFRVSAVNCEMLDTPLMRLFITDRNV